MKSINSFKAVYNEKFHKGIILSPTPIFMTGETIGFFYGASQLRGSQCGASVVLKLVNGTVYKLDLGFGKGTNTRAELLALCVLLLFALKKNITTIQVVGDSKLIIDWLNQVCKLQVINLEG